MYEFILTVLWWLGLAPVVGEGGMEEPGVPPMEYVTTSESTQAQEGPDMGGIISPNG